MSGRRVQGPKGEDAILLNGPGTNFFTVRQLQLNRAIVLFWDFPLRFLVPRYVHDDPRYGTFGELTWT